MRIALALLRRPSVVASLAVHAVVVFSLARGGAWGGEAPHALVLPFLADEAQGLEDTAPEPPAPEVPRDLDSVLAAPTPPDPVPPPEEPPDLPLDAPPVADGLPPFPAVVPPHLRTRPPAPAPAPAPAVAVSIPPRPAPVPRVASRAGAGAVVGAVPTPGNRAPDYPAEARAQGWEGTVRLDLLVASDGTVASVRLAATSGHPALDAAAAAAAWGWRFAPRRVDGVPTAEWVRVPVVFRLR